jgi:hypothetical protein
MTMSGTGQGAVRAPSRRYAPHVSWDDRDRGWSLTLVAMIGLGVGVVLGAFGMPPIDLHTPPHQLGIMDPLCGGTRAVRYTLLGRWHDAWRYNPLSPVLVVGAALALVRHMMGTLTGRWLTISIPRRLIVVVALLVLVPLEVNQQLHASLLQGP